MAVGESCLGHQKHSISTLQAIPFPFFSHSPQKNHLQMIQKEAVDNKQTMMDGLSTGILLAIN
jgi:hypothetical protein